MGTYMIPRNLKGETRILYIFSVKSLVTTAVVGGVGLIFYFIIGMLFGAKVVGAVILGIFALIGFGVGTIKIPTLSGLSVTKKVGGESLDEIIRRYTKFRMNKKKYSYFITKEEQ